MTIALSEDIALFIWQLFRYPVFASIAAGSALILGIAIATFFSFLFHNTNQE